MHHPPSPPTNPKTRVAAIAKAIQAQDDAANHVHQWGEARQKDADGDPDLMLKTCQECGFELTFETL